MSSKPRRWILAFLSSLALLAGACSTDSPDVGDGTAQAGDAPITIGAIPDQDPEVLQRLYGTLSSYLSDELGVEVEYVPVTDYAAAVSLFKVGDLDMVWFGGLTGVQARLQVPGAQAIVQREIDPEFHSVFIANNAAGLDEIEAVEGLSVLKGKTFTFGSESSTSGRLMPQYFLDQAGVATEDFQGEPGYSGSHDRTIALVQAGTFQAGALNEQVWDDRVADGTVDLSQVSQIFRTPAYHDYHWVARPELVDRDGGDLVERIKQAFLELDSSEPQEAQILEAFGTDGFIETENDNYGEIEEIGRKLGLIT